MAIKADQEMNWSDPSLESQDSGDLVPYELLDPELRLGTGEVLPGWYARGAPRQENEGAQRGMQVREPAAVREDLAILALFSSLDARMIPQESTLDEDKKRQVMSCYYQASILFHSG